jgi:MFS family permease
LALSFDIQQRRKEKTMDKKIESNIWKLYLIKASRSFMLMMPIIVLFFKENGLSMKEVFGLQALFSVVVIVLEVPTGYFSDLLGRKISIVIGGVIATIGFSIYALSHGFWGFLLAEVTLGLGLSFVSGADSALLYDSLEMLKRQNEYQKMEGRGMSFGMISESLASVAGGMLALMSLRFPLYFDALTTSFMIPIALSLIEPNGHILSARNNRIASMIGLKDISIWDYPKTMLNLAKYSFKEHFKPMINVVKFALHEHAEIKWLIIYSSLVAASTLTMVWFIQVYLNATGVPLELFGSIWAVFLLVAAFFSWHAHRVENLFGRKISLILLILLPVAGYLLLSSFWFAWSGIFIFLFYVTRGLNNPVTASYINRLVSTEIRATVMSTKNLVGRLIFSIVGPLAGWINDAWSLKIALVSSGLAFLIFGLVSLFFMRRHKVL